VSGPAARPGATQQDAAEQDSTGLRAVLFDMDGLLVDSEPLWFEAECAVMDRLGGHWDGADQQALLGGSLPKTVAYLLDRATRPASAQDVGRWLVDGVTELLARRAPPVLPGAAELVDGVRAAGIPTALVTSSQRQIMDAVLSRLGLPFDVTVCAEDVRATKPDPEPYRCAAARLAVDPRRCVALEDSPNGVAAAERAGCRLVVVPSLVPIPARPGRVVVSSLREVGLPLLRALATGR
jgi:HAD superfamily hydrolase (TIGR01509 family)